MNCDTARQNVYLSWTRPARWRAKIHLRLCSNCKHWQEEQRATEALLESLPLHTIPVGVRDAVRETMYEQERIEKERGPLTDTAITTQKSEGLVEATKEVVRRNYRIRLVWAAFGILVISLVWLGARALRKPADQTARGPSAPSVAGAVPVLLVLPEDFDDGTPFEGKIIALIEPAEKALLPEVLPIEEALAHMLLSDLAADANVRVLSRKKVSAALAEIRMGEAALTEPQTTQHLGKAIEADTLVSIKVIGDLTEIGAALQLLSQETGKPAWSKKFFGSPDDLLSLEKEMLAALRERLDLKEPASGEGRIGEPFTLAVFDFQPAGPATELDQHAEGLADLLSAYLSEDSGDVRLVERERLATVLGERELIFTQRTREEEAWLGRMLGAQRFLYTSMVQWKDQVRFDSHLVETETGLIVAALSVQGDTDRTPALLKELAKKIARSPSPDADISSKKPSAEDDELSLEAAIHFARGCKLIRLPDYEQAQAEFEKAAFLAPDNVDVWWMLIRTCHINERYGEAASYARTFLKKHPVKGGDLHWRLADALEAKRDWAGAEAELRAILNNHEYKVEWKIRECTWRICKALLLQGRWEEAFRYCKEWAPKSKEKEGLSHAWGGFLYGLNEAYWLMEDDAKAPAPGVLGLVSRVVEALPTGKPLVDQGIAHPLAKVILMHCLYIDNPGPYLYYDDAQDLAEGLEIAERIAAKFKDGNRLPAVAHMTRGIILARMERHEEALEAFRTVLRDYPDADVDQWDWLPFTPPVNGMAHFYMGLVYEHIENREAAVSEYREAVRLLDPNRPAAQYALELLKDWEAALPPKAPREKRVQGYPPFWWGDTGLRLVDWLRTHDYQFWGAAYEDNPRLCSGEFGTLIIIHDGNIPALIDPEDLRTWVMHGGRLLLLCRQFSDWSEEGGDVESRSASLDQTLNWVLFTFGMSMDPTADWISAEIDKKRVVPTGHPMTKETKPLEYDGDWWPLICPEEAAALRLADPKDGSSGSSAKGPVVAAAREVGLGRVAVVTVRNWFPCGGAWENVDPGELETALLADVMGWLAAPEMNPERRRLAKQFIEPWQIYAGGRRINSVEKFRELEGVPGFAGEETKYFVARALSYSNSLPNKLKEAAPRFRELVRSASDPWLRRASAYWLCRIYREANRPKEAEEYFHMVASESGDKLWAKAAIELGNLWTERKDYKRAETYFREVAKVIPHSEERMRALFGLGYALEQQGRLGEAARLYRAVSSEYGNALVPSDLIYDVGDPWESGWLERIRRESEDEAHVVQEITEYRLNAVEKAQTGKRERQVKSTGKRSLFRTLKSLWGGEED